MASKIRGVRPRGNSIQIDIQFRGRRIRETLRIPPTRSNLRFAARKRESMLYALETGSFSGSGIDDLTLGECLTRFIADHAPVRKKSTIFGYWKIFDSRPELHEISVSFLDRSWILGWISDEINDKGTARKTINNILSLCRASVAYAVENSWLDDNPFSRVRSLRNETPEPDPLSVGEIEALFSACNSPWESKYLAFSIFTGMRTGELIELRWSDVLSDRICVRSAFVDGEKTSTKTASGIREIPIFSPLRDFLSVSSSEEEHVLINPDGKPWFSSSQIRRRLWIPLVDRAGIRYRKPYSTRHTFASLALSAGEDPTQVASWMGHSDWASIRKNYARWVPSAARHEPGSRLESVLSSKLHVIGDIEGVGWNSRVEIVGKDEDF